MRIQQDGFEMPHTWRGMQKVQQIVIAINSTHNTEMSKHGLEYYIILPKVSVPQKLALFFPPNKFGHVTLLGVAVLPRLLKHMCQV